MEKEDKIRQITYSFRKMHHLFYKQMWHHANQLGVTVVQLQILKILDDEPNLSLAQLCERLNSGKSAVSTTVDRLVKANYIKRDHSKADRRAIVLTLTPLGKEKKEEGRAIYFQQLSPLGDISEQDMDELLRLHQLVQDKMNLIGDDKK
ncbi:MarR family winged helix-turn-helix transcriptional regulator [Oceanobacillus manasiensis]|uniref:MarR family winged helix-turn-helix transcriptional regulator n=1 Tax=Oceanobacillus manasiensis TaxID=586413 RepID=UPI0005A641A3|nr:MarR family transcriptional regulator [Oceanobacillus manasiensis]